MKKLFKALSAVAAVFTVVVGILTVLNRGTNRNRIDDYLKCDLPEDL